MQTYSRQCKWETTHFCREGRDRSRTFSHHHCCCRSRRSSRDMKWKWKICSNFYYEKHVSGSNLSPPPLLLLCLFTACHATYFLRENEWDNGESFTKLSRKIPPLHLIPLIHPLYLLFNPALTLIQREKTLFISISKRLHSSSKHTHTRICLLPLNYHGKFDIFFYFNRRNNLKKYYKSRKRLQIFDCKILFIKSYSS